MKVEGWWAGYALWNAGLAHHRVEVPCRDGVPRQFTEGRCKATWKREFKLPWREAVSPNHHDDVVDSDQQVVDKSSLSKCTA